MRGKDCQNQSKFGREGFIKMIVNREGSKGVLERERERGA